MKKRLTIILLSLLSIVSATQARPQFDRSMDLLVAQFDSKPDPDDIHAIAVLGSMLAHEDFQDVEYFAVAGAVGIQRGRYIAAPDLFNLAFGEKDTDWTDAMGDREGSITRIKNKAKSVLLNGGKVWVQEAGQSDLTRDWGEALLHCGVPAETIRSNVIVVQHSQWNEGKTTPEDLEWLQANANYQQIDDGNYALGKSADRGPDTASYNNKDRKYLLAAKQSPNAKARALWAEADRVIQANGYFPSYSFISIGGVDFSDCVENVWIFDVSDVGSIDKFWAKFVINTP